MLTSERIHPFSKKYCSDKQRQEINAAFAKGCNVLRLEYETGRMNKRQFYRWRNAYKVRLADLHYNGFCTPDSVESFNALDLRYSVPYERCILYEAEKTSTQATKRILFNGLLLPDEAPEGV